MVFHKSHKVYKHAVSKNTSFAREVLYLDVGSVSPPAQLHANMSLDASPGLGKDLKISTSRILGEEY